MKATVAKSAGFCFGVDRAVTIVRELVGRGERVSTLGPIIHNKQVVDELENAGVTVVESPGEASADRTLVIRSHGVGADVYSLLDERDIHYVDATCPFVAKIHRIVREKSAQGAHIIIVGSRNHAEVQGICGWISGAFTVIETEEEAENFRLEEGIPICIVSQTTFNYKKLCSRTNSIW